MKTIESIANNKCPEVSTMKNIYVTQKRNTLYSNNITASNELEIRSKLSHIIASTCLNDVKKVSSNIGEDITKEILGGKNGRGKRNITGIR